MKKQNLPKGHCNLCHQEIFESIDPEKIITCARCVQILLMASQQNKIEYRNSLLSQGLEEQARSVESFIIDETSGEVAIQKRTPLQRRSNRVVSRFSKRLTGLSLPIRKDLEQ